MGSVYSCTGIQGMDYTAGCYKDQPDYKKYEKRISYHSRCPVIPKFHIPVKEICACKPSYNKV